MLDAVPERWLGCPPFGEQVRETRFVPLKNPLGERFNADLFRGHRFTPRMFCEEQQKRGRTITHIISFAGTQRYTPEDLIMPDGRVVESAWIRCGKEAPTDRHYKDFMEVYNRIVAVTPDAIIAIHCTHGFNRTGFIISRFLCEELNYNIITAMNMFKEARPPGIYKKDYVEELIRGRNPEGTFDRTTLRPEEIWAYPDRELLPCYTEPVKDGSQYSKLVENETSDEEHLGKIIERHSYLGKKVKRHVEMMCRPQEGRWAGKFPGSQPVSLELKNLGTLTGAPGEFMATYKSDGVRYFLLAIKEGVFLIDRKLEVRQVTVRVVDREGNQLEHTLLDGELVKETRDGVKTFSFLIFDIIEFEEFPLFDHSWDTRMDYVSLGVVAFRKMWKEKNPEDFANDVFDVATKRQWHLNDLHSLFDYVKQSVYHVTDGIIFTSLPMLYILGTCTKILKWKPIEQNSVDFIGMWNNGVLYLGVRRFSKKKGGAEDIAISTLTGTYEDGYLESLNSRIIECAYDVESGGWFPMRTRTDKTTPNAYQTFAGVCQSIDDNLTEEGLAQTFLKLV